MTPPVNPSTGQPWTPEEFLDEAQVFDNEGGDGSVLRYFASLMTHHSEMRAMKVPDRDDPQLWEWACLREKDLASLMTRHTEAVRLLRKVNKIGCPSGARQIHEFLEREDAG